jgi:hypothetical protein
MINTGIIYVVLTLLNTLPKSVSNKLECRQLPYLRKTGGGIK